MDDISLAMLITAVISLLVAIVQLIMSIWRDRQEKNGDYISSRPNIKNWRTRRL